MTETTTPIEISRRLIEDLRDLSFSPPISHVYQPWDYAWEPYEEYLLRFGAHRPRKALLVGMNPGPWGMGQVGIPFGAIGMVRDWMGIEAPVSTPEHPHPDRPVDGFDCSREEVSGSRLYGWARSRYETPDRFFDTFFVHNYCPLLIYDEDGSNRTPPKLRKDERQAVMPSCDQALRDFVAYFTPEFVIGVGAYAEKRARAALKGHYDGVVGRILHPSPASPRANRGWAEQAEAQLLELGVPL